MNKASNITQGTETEGNGQKAVVSAFKSGASFYEFDSITNKWIDKFLVAPLI